VFGIHNCVVLPDADRFDSSSFNAWVGYARVDVIARSFAVEFDGNFELVSGIRSNVLRRGNPGSGDKPAVQRNAHNHIAHGCAGGGQAAPLERGGVQHNRMFGIHDGAALPDTSTCSLAGDADQHLAWNNHCIGPRTQQFERDAGLVCRVWSDLLQHRDSRSGDWIAEQYDKHGSLLHDNAGGWQAVPLERGRV
jgi:hypothetical protein